MQVLVTSEGVTTSTIDIARGSIEQISLTPRNARAKAAILTQPGAAHIASGVAEQLSQIGLVVETRELPDREAAKTWQVVSETQEWLANVGLGRSDTIVGVGGGTITDVSGFVAATWLRGVEAVYVPTTLLAAIDAAIGGKTGINLAGKNLVGAFAHPTQVLIDLDVLDAVPRDVQREGWAEAYKTALLSDSELLDGLTEGGPDTPLDRVVPICVEFKARVVSADFREQGNRAVLNLGHTIGHAIEFASGCSHGEAVSVGTVAAAAISQRRYGFGVDVRAALESFDLPVTMAADVDRVRSLLKLDKKNDAQGIRMVLLRGIGDPVIDHVTPEEIDLGLTSIGL